MFRYLFKSPVLLLKFSASIMYIFMGCMVLLVPSIVSFLSLESYMVIILGIILLAYGLFRFFRAAGELKEQWKNQNER